MSKIKTIREIPFSVIERRFALSGYWFGSKWCPAVDTKDGGGYTIRVQVSETHRGRDTTTKWDYFELAADGTVLMAPYGYARDYKPARITGLDEAKGRYVDPDPHALQLRFGGLS